MPFSDDYGSAVREGLQLCGVDKLFLQIHDASFPSKPGEDIGRGSPYSEGAMDFLRFTHHVGFNGIQLGPQGATARDNASPYDGTVFSRNPLSLPLAALLEWELLSQEWIDERVKREEATPGRVSYAAAWELMDEAIATAYAEFANNRDRHRVLAARLERFRESNSDWLERDALYYALFEANGRKSWRDWPDDGSGRPDRLLFSDESEVPRARLDELRRDHAGAMECAELVQLLVHDCHLDLRHEASRVGLKLYADLQIGLSNQDCWAYQSALVDGYYMGAPPSRTNPDGQPWGFAVLDPAKYMTERGPGAALMLVIERLRKLYAEYDGIRVDHPHGWVCPWVYRSDIEDPFEAVRGGARLFSSPDLPEHPRLAEFAIPEAHQLDRSQERHTERWVAELTEEQIDQYAKVFTRIVAPDASSRQQLDLVCEVLSTLPYPLKCVLDRFGLGRFRILQKVDPDNPTDVYRSELAEPVDWIMLGNHDTPPIWQLAREWTEKGTAVARATDLARRLCPKDHDRQAWISKTASCPAELVHALFADLLISRARSIMVFMSDLFGIEEPYNVPGTVNDINWTLRVPRDFESGYREDALQGRALNLPRALCIALRSPALDLGGHDPEELIQQLEKFAGERSLQDM
ncbi:4-alpha-glucanotransferase [Sulfuriroseicoccus oceanibius]|uniref:4-alpha-glucanotransferase n=1 Tax=Sulfuriroseicoccus oceanibius TaxID=2707525 RepID=A0A6B3LD03_9BACT|nr:4-alpha-glucanotransferase [Sulfuriroseicoccus oceanibius]QQL44713.1 4-alpha-glucanotransferase [Sulfuriroseicoccus oceanibius]